MSSYYRFSLFLVLAALHGADLALSLIWLGLCREGELNPVGQLAMWAWGESGMSFVKYGSAAVLLICITLLATATNVSQRRRWQAVDRILMTGLLSITAVLAWWCHFFSVFCGELL